MTKAPDVKLDLLAKSPLCSGMSERELRTLGRLAEVVIVPAGTVLRSKHLGTTWSYHVLKGTVLVSSATGLSAVNAGSWLFTAADREPAEVTAATGVVALAVGARELPSVRALLSHHG